MLAIGALCGACTVQNSDDDHAFDVSDAAHAADPGEPTIADGWIVYRALEAGDGGVDLNGDGDAIDSVACAIAAKAHTDTVLGVAAESTHVLGSHIYVVVSEAEDGRDWNVDADQLDTVLVHWQFGAPVPLDPADDFIDTLVSSGTVVPPQVASGRLYYAAELPGAGAGETSLYYLTKQSPTTPTAVIDAGGANLVVRVLGESEGLLFLGADEVLSGLELNADGDANDSYVLALLDTTLANSELAVTGLALADSEVPIAADASDAHDWTVAFLVSEAAQGDDLNDPALFAGGWVAENCTAVADGDLLDEVLHWITFETWLAGNSDPVNTGIPGELRVIALDGAVATLCPEGDAGCDLDDDGDTIDSVPRWIQTTANALPAGDIVHMLAASAVAGGAHGLAWNGGRLVAVLSEQQSGRDLDTSVLDHDLVAWLDPVLGTAAVWHVSHPSGAVGTGIGGLNFVGADWLAERPQEGRLGLGFEENTAGDVLNLPNFTLNNCLAGDLVVKDTDDLDSLPVWSDFGPGPALDFDGIGYALATNNGGIVVVRGQVFFRGNEGNDNHEYNGDADTSDDILFRNAVASGCSASPMSIATSLDEPAVYSDGIGLCAFHCDEAQAGEDLNGDGDELDFVLRYFKF
ncbi:MAG: hypothetical protein EPO68_13680 [Planctomycetota bacterium]|nr:MAG: hypothetical protein EPO68_13680 [Planctomycetota bacterium]